MSSASRIADSRRMAKAWDQVGLVCVPVPDVVGGVVVGTREDRTSAAGPKVWFGEVIRERVRDRVPSWWFMLRCSGMVK